MDLGSPYFVMLAIGFALAFVWFLRHGQRLGLARVGLVDVCIAAVVAGMVGGRLLHVAVEPLPEHALGEHELAGLRAALPALDAEGRTALEGALRATPVSAAWLFIARMPPGAARSEAITLAQAGDNVPARLWYRANPGQVLVFWSGGLAYIGGLVLAVLACSIVVWRHGLPWRDMADLSAPAIILGLVFGRLGCFLGGCCFGQVCAPTWWSTAPFWYGPPVGGVSRYPTALLSVGFALLLFFALRWLFLNRRVRGEVFLAMFALYAPGRYWIESLRDDPRGGAGDLSTSQIAVLVTGLPALVLWVGLRLRSSAPLDDQPIVDGGVPTPADA